MAWNRRVLGRALMAGHGLLMLCLGMALFIVSNLMSDPLFEKSGYAAANVVTALGLLIPVSAFLVSARRLRHSRPLFVYLWVSALSIVCWATFWFAQSSPMNMPLLVLLAGLHGIFWSLWYVRMAYRFQASSSKAILLSIIAAAVSFLGMILATEAGASLVHAVATVAGYAIYIGISTLGVTLYLFRESAMEVELMKTEVVPRGVRQVPVRAFAETESMAS